MEDGRKRRGEWCVVCGGGKLGGGGGGGGGVFFFFNDTATTEIYTLSLHDALPISAVSFNVVYVLSGISPMVSRQCGIRNDC